jgi:hypothetical protein
MIPHGKQSTGRKTMAIRRRQVHPDEILTLRSGEQVPVVSDEAFLGAVLEVGRMVCFAGGTMNATVMRAPTDLPGEMATVGAVVEWKDRTDAREQPEPSAEPQPIPVSMPNAGHMDEGNHVVNSRTGEEYVVTPANGQGSAALPFQREEQPVDADEALAQVDAALAVPAGARVEAGQTVGLHPDQPPVEVEAPQVVHEQGANYRPVGPAAPQSDDGVDDGFVPEADVDLSEIPESLR